jgi:hypothetical protein
MALTSLFFILLMAASQAVSWTYVIKSNGAAVYRAVWQLSLFYVGWALYKKIFLGDEKELGHISFGLLALATYFEKKWLSVAANLLLLANFSFALYIIASFTPRELAHMIKNDDTNLGLVWGYTFDAYIISSSLLWAFVLRKLVKLTETPVLIRLQPPAYEPVNDMARH